MHLLAKLRQKIRVHGAGSFSLPLLFLGIALLLPAPVRAQGGPTGSLSGVVQDPNGAAVPGVAVTAQNSATNETRTATTNEEGRWVIPQPARRASHRVREVRQLYTTPDRKCDRSGHAVRHH
jgi:hypothetical protein